LIYLDKFGAWQRWMLRLPQLHIPGYAPSALLHPPCPASELIFAKSKDKKKSFCYFPE
jgi:hypothetical protein